MNKVIPPITGILAFILLIIVIICHILKKYNSSNCAGTSAEKAPCLKKVSEKNYSKAILPLWILIIVLSIVAGVTNVMVKQQEQ